MKSNFWICIRSFLAATAVGALALSGGCGGGSNDGPGFRPLTLPDAAQQEQHDQQQLPPVIDPAVKLPEAKVKWIDAWGAMQVPNGTYYPVSKTSPGQSDLIGTTLRQTIRVSLGGEKFRIKLSNRFGMQPVTLTDVHVALRGEQVSPDTDRSPIDVSTDHEVTFGSQRGSVVIREGGDIESDAFDLKIAPGTELVVSFYISSGALSNKSSSIFPADTAVFVKGQASKMQSFSKESIILSQPAVYLLEGVQVEANDPSVRNIVAFGDSITIGGAASDFATASWPARLAARIDAAEINTRATVINSGISANQLTYDPVDKGYQVRGLDRFAADVLDRPGLTDVVVLIGTNDLDRAPFSKDANSISREIIDGYMNLMGQTRDRDPSIRIWLGTITPFYGYSTTRLEDARITVNQWILKNAVAKGFAGVVDFSRALASDEIHGEKNEVAIDERCAGGKIGVDAGVDGLHPHDVGYDVMGALAYDVLFGKTEKPQIPCNTASFPY